MLRSILFSLIGFSTLAADAARPTPLEALQALKEGNERFTKSSVTILDTGVQAREALETHEPVAIIVGCSDARVSPELLFNQSLGQLFVVRLAGNVVDQMALESIEFAIAVLKTPLLVVLGHESCGAVRAALKTDNPESIPTSLMRALQPAIDTAQAALPNGTFDQVLNAAIRANVNNVTKAIVENSTIVREALAEKKLLIASGEYYIHSGEVQWF